MFLEGKFAYAVSDFLEDKKETGQYQKLKEKHKQYFGILEKIAGEAFSLKERKTTRAVLTEIAFNSNAVNAMIVKSLEEVFKYHLYLFYKG